MVLSKSLITGHFTLIPKLTAHKTSLRKCAEKILLCGTETTNARVASSQTISTSQYVLANNNELFTNKHEGSRSIQSHVTQQ